MAFEWKPALSVGVNDIDDQHKELFARVNKLLDATSQGKGKEEIGKIIDFLGAYVVTHFGTEEKYMLRLQYPHLSSHKAQHQQFLSEFSALKERFEKEGATSQLVILIQRRVCDWLMTHIGGTDKMLGSFLQTRSAAAYR